MYYMGNVRGLSDAVDANRRLLALACRLQLHEATGNDLTRYA